MTQHPSMAFLTGRHLAHYTGAGARLRGNPVDSSAPPTDRSVDRTGRQDAGSASHHGLCVAVLSPSLPESAATLAAAGNFTHGGVGGDCAVACENAGSAVACNHPDENAESAVACTRPAVACTLPVENAMARGRGARRALSVAGGRRRVPVWRWQVRVRTRWRAWQEGRVGYWHARRRSRHTFAHRADTGAVHVARCVERRGLRPIRRRGRSRMGCPPAPVPTRRRSVRNITCSWRWEHRHVYSQPGRPQRGALDAGVGGTRRAPAAAGRGTSFRGQSGACTVRYGAGVARQGPATPQFPEMPPLTHADGRFASGGFEGRDSAHGGSAYRTQGLNLDNGVTYFTPGQPGYGTVYHSSPAHPAPTLHTLSHPHAGQAPSPYDQAPGPPSYFPPAPACPSSYFPPTPDHHLHALAASYGPQASHGAHAFPHASPHGGSPMHAMAAIAAVAHEV
jgi:hypothetical protein